MEPCRFVLILTFLIYALFYDMRILYIFLSLWGALLVFHLVSPNLYNSTRRKLMIATWDEPREGVIKFKYEADVTQVNEYIKEAREKLGVKVTMTHVILRIIGDVFSHLPDVNGRIVLGKYFPYDKVNLSCLVDIEGGKDLAVALVEDCDKRTIEDIAETVNERANRIKTNKDETHKNQVSTFKLLPSFLISFMTEVAQLISVDLGLSIPAMSLKKYQFGSAIVTNIGALNIKDAFAPFTPFARVPMLITLCETQNRPVVRGDKIEIAPIAFVNFTVDHRFLDGGRAKKIVGKLDEYFANPKQFSKLKKDK